MKINLRKYGVVSFFGKRDVTGNAFAKLGFWIVRIETAQETCDDYVRIGDGECDYDSHYNLLCEWDGGDCDPPSDCKCTTEQLHNKTCDWECNTEECEYDMGSCHPQGCTCDPEVFKNNDICDLHCNTKTCGYDPDCPVAGCQECSHDLLNND